MLHPDYQYSPRLVAPMAGMIASGHYDVVLGSRILGRGALAGGMPLYKYVANRALTFVENLLLGQKLSEYHSGYRAWSRRVLETLAEQTGGVAYFPRSLKEVDAIAAMVASDIRTQYTIAYHSTNPPSKGGYRQVHVEAKDKGLGRLDVRTRSGYYPRTSVGANASGGAPAGSAAAGAPE